MSEKEECKHEWSIESCTADSCIYRCQKCGRVWVEFRTPIIREWEGDFE